MSLNSVQKTLMVDWVKPRFSFMTNFTIKTKGGYKSLNLYPHAFLTKMEYQLKRLGHAASLRAAMNCIVLLSTCPQDIFPINGQSISVDPCVSIIAFQNSLALNVRDLGTLMG